MINLPEIFSNGAVYFPQNSIFSFCTHDIREGDKVGTITIRMNEGITNMWEAGQHIKRFMTAEKYDKCVSFPPARQIPGRENAAGKNFFKVVIKADVSDLEMLVIGLGGSLQDERLHTQRLDERTGAVSGASRS